MEYFKTNHLLSIHNPHKDKISSLQFNPAINDILASCCILFNKIAADKTFKIWKINSNTNQYKEEASYKFHAYGINQIKWYIIILHRNSDGNLIASGGNDFLINLTDVNYVHIY